MNEEGEIAGVSVAEAVWCSELCVHRSRMCPIDHRCVPGARVQTDLCDGGNCAVVVDGTNAEEGKEKEKWKRRWKSKERGEVGGAVEEVVVGRTREKELEKWMVWVKWRVREMERWTEKERVMWRVNEKVNVVL